MKIINTNLFILCVAVIFFVGCENRGDGNNTDNNDTMGIRSAPGSDTMTRNAPYQQADFIRDVIDNHQREKTWLQAGINKGSDPEVKELARRMLADHESMLKEFKNYASSKNIPMTDTGTAEIARLIEATEREIIDITEKGTEWDEEWADEIGDEQESLIRKFEREQNKIHDAELRSLVNNQLPKLRNHLESAHKLENKLDKLDNK